VREKNQAVMSKQRVLSPLLLLFVITMGLENRLAHNVTTGNQDLKDLLLQETKWIRP
jgi:hypothetical protein